MVKASTLAPPATWPVAETGSETETRDQFMVEKGPPDRRRVTTEIRPLLAQDMDSPRRWTHRLAAGDRIGGRIGSIDPRHVLSIGILHREQAMPDQGLRLRFDGSKQRAGLPGLRRTSASLFIDAFMLSP